MVNAIRAVQIVGYKNTGKTTLLCGLISRLAERGYRVGTIKHDAHQFEIDCPGTDTWKLREAGAQTVAITSNNRTAIMEERHTSLDQLLGRLHSIDIVLVEGFKFEKYPKIVIVRSEEHLELVHQAANVIGIASWLPLEVLRPQLNPFLPCFLIDDADSMARLILDHLHGG